ncbi:MAG TPA: DUF1579 family protein, partial [Phycisphaerae bacterium]|nr:DUF1579 family protein [Phycisphaerae bacterium]
GLIAFVGANVFSQDEKKPEGGGMPGMTPEMMQGIKDYMKNMKPGSHHEFLENFVGTWKTTTRMWMMGEGSGPPMTTAGKSDVKWVLGKRYVMEEHRGKMMMPDENMQMKEVDFEGIGMTGYDNDRNLYCGSWASNLNTTMLNFKGSVSQDKKTITFYGEMDEPMMKVYGRIVKYQVKLDSKDKHTFAVYDLMAGDNYKVFDITYERAE